MTKSEAFSLLALNEDASLAQVRARAAELTADGQVRLESAATPVLKRLYQRNLAEIADALALLEPELSQPAANNLPSSNPVLDWQTPPTAAPPRPATPPPPTPGPPPPPYAPPAAPAGKAPASNLRWIIVGAAVAVVALVAVLVLRRNNATPAASGSPAATAVAVPDSVAQTLAQLNGLMKPIAGGTFKFGLEEAVEGKPTWREPRQPKQLSMQSFELSAQEVTNEQWHRVMGGATRPGACPQCPVEQVSRPQVLAFIDSVNRWSGKRYRLPTDLEWEYAAKEGQAGVQRGTYLRYSSGNSPEASAWFSDNSQGKVHPVASRLANALGLYDMCGNVEEWTATEGDRYFNGALSYGTYIRGGCYLDPAIDRSVTFRRVITDASKGEQGVGFRIARDAK